MFCTERRASRAVPNARVGGRARAARGVVATAVAVVLALAGCAFPGGEEEGPDVDPSRVPSAGQPPAGVTDPATQPALAPFYKQSLAWRDCGEGSECASLTLPLDWNRPTGETIKMAVLRQRASSDRLGSIVINPGGPGVSGIEYAKQAQDAFGRKVTQHYDVVGFDPRGVGQSSPVKCLGDGAMEEYLSAEGSPDSPAELDAAVAGQRDFAAACEQNSGELLRHVDTVSVAKDLDVLRAALAEGRLTYYGASYGTYIGAWYAQTFPWRVGRLVLDGAVDPSLTSAEYVEGQAEGFSRALRAFVEDCQSERGCPLRGSLQDGLNQIGLLVDAADEAPLSTDSDRELTQSLMVTAIAMGLYSTNFWPQLTIGLDQALDGDGTGLLLLADAYYERDDAGRYAQTWAANPAIYCLDVAETRTPAEISAAAADLERRFPPLGGYLGWGALGCSQWPIKAVVPRQELSAAGAAPILVLGTVDDPATPYEWAQALASQLSSARLVTWEGSVHTAYRRGSACVDTAVEAYLIAGTLPADGLRCT